MDEIIMRIIKEDVTKAKRIVSNPDIPVLDKLFKILMEQSPKSGDVKEKMIEQFHQPNNAEMHQKSLVQSIIHLSPVLTEVLEQGIEEGIFSTPYPRETIELLLSSAQVIFDDGLFQWKPEEMINRAKAYIKMMEASVGAKEGSFDYMMEVLIKQK